MTSTWMRKSPISAAPCADSYGIAALSGAVRMSDTVPAGVRPKGGALLAAPIGSAAPAVIARELFLDGRAQRMQGWSVFSGTNPIALMAHPVPNASDPDPGGPLV